MEDRNELHERIEECFQKPEVLERELTQVGAVLNLSLDRLIRPLKIVQALTITGLCCTDYLDGILTTLFFLAELKTEQDCRELETMFGSQMEKPE